MNAHVDIYKTCQLVGGGGPIYQTEWVQAKRPPDNPSTSDSQVGSINITAAGISRRKSEATGNMIPINNSILLPIDHQGIHKTSEG